MCLQGYYSGDGAWGKFPPLELASFQSIKIVDYEAGAFSLFSTCSISGKNIFSAIFHNNLNMCFVHSFPMELEYIIYYLSPDAFSYVVSTLFLHAEHQDKVKLTYCV